MAPRARRPVAAVATGSCGGIRHLRGRPGTSDRTPPTPGRQRALAGLLVGEAAVAAAVGLAGASVLEVNSYWGPYVRLGGRAVGFTALAFVLAVVLAMAGVVVWRGGAIATSARAPRSVAGGALLAQPVLLVGAVVVGLVWFNGSQLPPDVVSCDPCGGGRFDLDPGQTRLLQLALLVAAAATGLLVAGRQRRRPARPLAGRGVVVALLLVVAELTMAWSVALTHVSGSWWEPEPAWNSFMVVNTAEAGGAPTGAGADAGAHAVGRWTGEAPHWSPPEVPVKTARS